MQEWCLTDPRDTCMNQQLTTNHVCHFEVDPRLLQREPRASTGMYSTHAKLYAYLHVYSITVNIFCIVQSRVQVTSIALVSIRIKRTNA